MFDDVTCEYPLPDGREVSGRAFQTKSLWCCMDRFTVTAAGRLIFHQHQYPEPGVGDTRLGRPWHVADVDLNYHGDLDLYGIDTAGREARYVARFTHGSVEWVRPYDDISAVPRAWLYPCR
mgnify:CR=1 FL=1